MLIAQISDTHILAPESGQPAASLRADCLRLCVADINEQTPYVVIFTGDTVQYGAPEEYALLRELLSPLESPLYLVPGNRDDNDALRAAFGDKAYLTRAEADADSDRFEAEALSDFRVRIPDTLYPHTPALPLRRVRARNFE